MSRLADFAMRLEGDPTGGPSLAGAGRYVTIHPMADEAELLEKLRMEPSECGEVDLYWEFEGDVRFVQIIAEAGVRCSPGMYARKGPSGGVYILAVVKDAQISSQVVTAVLSRAAEIRIDVRTLSETLSAI